MGKLKSLQSRVYNIHLRRAVTPDAASSESPTSPGQTTATTPSASPLTVPAVVTAIATRDGPSDRSSQSTQQRDPPPAPSHARASEVDSTPSLGSRNLWAEAWSKLENDQPGIHRDFAAILAAEAPDVVSDPVDLNEGLLRSLVEKKLESIQQRQWKISIGSKSMHIRDIVERCFGFITVTKDFLLRAGALEPVHAGLPVAALCIAVSLLTRDKEQNEDLAKALETATRIVQRYVVTEKVYISHNECPNENFVESIVSLYSKVLLLEAKLIMHLSKKTLSRISQNVWWQTDWAVVDKSVQQADKECERWREVAEFDSTKARYHKLQEVLKQLDRDAVAFWQTYRREQEKYYDSERARACMTLLRAIDYEDYKNRNPEPSDGTCQWFKTDTRFQDWLEEANYSCLWVTADPGCGKSVLSKYLVDKYLRQQIESDTTICYYFFKNEAIASLGTSAICSLLHQIFGNKRTTVLMHHIESEYQNNGNKLAHLFDRLWSVFEAVIQDNCMGRIVVILDALDECAPNDQRRLLKKLQSLAKDDGSLRSLKLLITSRPHVADATGPLLQKSVKVVRLSGEAGAVSDGISQEIQNVIEQRLEAFRLERREKGIKDSAHLQIRNSILDRGNNRTYLWVSFVFQDLFDRIYWPLAALQGVFEQLPPTVEEQYERMLRNSTDKGRALRLLELIIGAPKPMEARHLYVTLHSTEANSDITSLEPDNTQALHNYLRGLCGCFISITQVSKEYYGRGLDLGQDQYSVRLIHESAREFLVERQSRSTGHGSSFEWKGVISDQKAYRTWAESCLCFIFAANRFETVNENAQLKETTSQDLLSGNAIDTVHGQPEVDHRRSVPKKENSYRRLPTWAVVQKAHSFRAWEPICAKLTEDETCDARTLSPLIPLMKQMCSDIMCGDFTIYTQTGQGMLESYFDWNALHKSLFVAVFFDSPSIVASILESDPLLVNVIDRIQNFTPFTFSLWTRKHHCIAYFCKRNDVSVGIADRQHRTALHLACRAPALLAVRRILSNDEANVNLQDIKGRSALMLACISGDPRYVDTVRELLRLPSLDVNLQDSTGRTALMMVSDVELLRELLKSPCLDVNLQNFRGRTALMLACEGDILKYIYVLRELLKLPSLNVNLQDFKGRSALMLACEGGNPNCADTVRELLKLPSLDLNLQDSKGRTALMVARDVDIMHELLNVPSLSINVRDHGGNTALHLFAARSDSSNKFEVLVQELRVDVNVQDGRGETALMYAAARRFPARVTFLSRRGDLHEHPECRRRYRSYGVPQVLYGGQMGKTIVGIQDNPIFAMCPNYFPPLESTLTSEMFVARAPRL